MANLKIKDLQGELENRKAEYALGLNLMIQSATDLLTRKPSTHHGHNLGNRAAELSALAGKIEMLENVIRWAKDAYYDGEDDPCPGCGCVPGEGKTAGCTHPEGCGYDAKR